MEEGARKRLKGRVWSDIFRDISPSFTSAHAHVHAHHTHTPHHTTPHHTRLQRLEHLASKFDSKAQKVEVWALSKDSTLENTEDIESSNLAEITVRGREREEGREGGREEEE